MMNQEGLSTVNAQGGGYGPPPGGGGYGPPPGGGYGQPMAPGGYGPPGGVPMPGGAPMAPPGGGPPPNPGAGTVNPELEKSMNTWFILSIVSIVCGCGCLAAVPIYLTHAGAKSLAEGNVADAESKLRIAKICIILGLVGYVLAIIGWVIWAIVFGGLAAVGNM
ncbi:hypothetical protein ACFL5O_03965 [Myxococcota bacterium]